MFLFGVVVFALSSAAIGLAPTEGWLVAGRALQGAGAAFMMPATLSIITVTFPPEERGKAIGTWAGVSALALAIGPVVGGALAEYVSWRAIFFLNLPVAVGAVAVTLFATRESRDESREHAIDWPGIAALSIGSERARARPGRGQRLGLGLGPDRGAVRRRGRRAGHLRADRAAGARADGGVLAVPLEDVPRREPRRVHRLLRDVRDVLLHRALSAEHPRLLRGRGRRALPPLHADDRADRAGGRAAVRPRRPAAADGERAHAGRVRAVPPDAHHRRHGLRAAAPGVRPDGHRHGAGDVADVHGRHELGGAREGRRGLRASCR